MEVLKNKQWTRHKNSLLSLQLIPPQLVIVSATWVLISNLRLRTPSQYLILAQIKSRTMLVPMCSRHFHSCWIKLPLFLWKGVKLEEFPPNIKTGHFLSTCPTKHSRSNKSHSATNFWSYQNTKYCKRYLIS